jgi:hypothetical protein
MIAAMRALSPVGPVIVLAVSLVWAAPGLTAESDLWLEVDAPVAGATRIGPVGLVLVRGFAGVGLGQDIVLLIDTSGSTFDPAGYDVDGDGKVGRRLRSADDPFRSWNPRRQCSDPGDTIRAAELAAARSLASELSRSGRVRLAIVGFDGAAHTLAPLGEPSGAAEHAIEVLENSLEAGESNLAGALDHAAALLGSGEPGRARSVVLLSDGLAEHRGASDDGARLAAAEAADRLGELGIRVHSFGLAAPGSEGAAVLETVSARSGGSWVAVDDLAELAEWLLRLELSPLEQLDLRNASTDLPARAVRVLPGGAFDGVVPLAPGLNRIEVVAQWPGGPPRRIERTVVFEERPAATIEEARAVAAELDELRRRTLELELATAVERGRSQAEERLLELEASASILD